MGLEDVKRDILAQATKEAARIGAEADAEISELKAESKEHLKERKRQAKEALDRECTRLRQRREAEDKAAMQEELLAKKRALIDAAVAAAKERLGKEEVKKGYLKQLLAKAQRELPIAKVYARKGSGLKGITLVPKDIDGLVAENKDGSISIDYSYDTLLQRIKETSLKEISEVLFP